MKNIIYLITLSLLFNSCSKDDPVIPNQEELITTIVYTLTPRDSGSVVVLNFKDLDGDGGNNPEISTGTFNANTVYDGILNLLNEQETPVEIISEEIEEESDEHQFFYQSTINSLSVTYNDSDKNNLPLGLKTVLTTGATSSGKLSITLRHEPDKSATGVSDGDISNAGGETDIEVTFDIYVQ